MKKILLIILMILLALSLLILKNCGHSRNVDICDLPAPNSLVATPVTSTSVNLNWSLVPTALNYNVQIFSIDEADSLTLVQTLNNVNPPLIVNGLTPNVLYEAIVRANCPNGTSSINSSEVRFRLPGILIEDVVMLAPSNIMPKMDSDACPGSSSSTNVPPYKITGWQANDKDVYLLEILDGSNYAAFKLGIKENFTFQYRKIKDTNWTSKVNSSRNKIVIMSGSSSLIGEVDVSSGDFTVRNIGNVNFSMVSTHCN